MRIRDSLKSDFPGLEQLYPAAFPEEDLLSVVRGLETGEAERLSLVAEADDDEDDDEDSRGVLGHVFFTRCRLVDRPEKLALLGPIAVTPARQRGGMGRALVEAGVARLRGDGYAAVYVLGDPNLYSRYGFVREDAVKPPYPLPAAWDGAWRSMALQSGAAALSGVLETPAIWRDPALWTE